MQINAIDLAPRQKLPQELLALVSGRAMPSQEGAKGPNQVATEKVVEPASPVQIERAVYAINEVVVTQ